MAVAPEPAEVHIAGAQLYKACSLSLDPDHHDAARRAAEAARVLAQRHPANSTAQSYLDTAAQVLHRVTPGPGEGSFDPCI
jgi:hypothetical protein